MSFKLQVERLTTENNLLLERLVGLEMRIERIEKKGLKWDGVWIVNVFNKKTNKANAYYVEEVIGNEL